MRESLAGTLLSASALLMLFGAAGYTFALLPDLHGDLIEIGVRPSVLGGTVLHLRFAAMAMFVFAVMVSVAAIRAMRGAAPDRLPLALIAVAYIVFGALAFSRSHNPHHLGTLVMGVLIGAALAVPRPGDPPRDGTARNVSCGLTDHSHSRGTSRS
jgi:hypothetical protein